MHQHASRDPVPSAGFSSDAQTALAHLTACLALDTSAADLRFCGEAPRLDSHHQLVAAQAAAIAAVAHGVASRWRDAKDCRQAVEIDALQAASSLNPAYFQRQNGHSIAMASLARELKAAFYRTADGRWFFPIGSYPHLRDAVLALLNCPNTPEALGASIGRWEAQKLEDAFASARLPGVFARSPEEWAAHPQGRAMWAEPVVSIEKIGESEPEAVHPDRRPLDDLRILDVSHVIAGPVVARTFAEHGADVLRISSPMQPDPPAMTIDTGIGKRCAFIDLTLKQDAQRLRDLAAKADVFVQSWAPGSLDRRGLAAEQLAGLRPGIIYVSVSCFGFSGPWAGRKGFEQLGQTASGICVTDARDGKPRVVPTNLLNDYLTGYLGTAGALAALARRARDGGSYHVKVSLTRTSMWVQQLGLRTIAAQLQTLDDFRPRLQQRFSAFGMLEQLGPVAQFSATPAAWVLPPAPLGSSPPSWAW